MGTNLSTTRELFAHRDAPDPRQLDAMRTYLRWVRTGLPALGAAAVLAVWGWTDEPSLLRTAALLAASGILIGPLLVRVAATRIGPARTVCFSAYLDVFLLAAISAQLAGVAIVAPAFVWSIVVCAAFCSPRDTLAVTLLGALVAIVVPLSRGYDDPLLLVLDVLGLVTIGTLIAVLQVEQQRGAARRRRLEQQLQDAQELAHIGSWEWDKVADVRRWSPEMYRIFGRPEGAAIGPDALFGAIVPSDRARVQSRIDDGFDERGIIEFDASIERPDGSVRAVHVIGTASRTDPDRLVVGSVQDVTDLRRLDRLRDEFVAAASHELRTPTSIILGFASTLSQRWEALSEPERIEFVGQIETAARRLSLLIEDVLQVSHIESGHIRCEQAPVELRAEVLELVREWPPADTIVAHAPEPIVAMADALRVRQIITNLLVNAARYSPAGRSIIVSIAALDGMARVSVRDEGPGIPRNDQERIFDRFVRLEPSGVGTGLGLYISRRLAEVQGGTLEVDSVPGHGATFTLLLPRVSG